MAFSIFKLKDGFRVLNGETGESAHYNNFNELIQKIDLKKGIELYLPAEDFYVRKVQLPNLEGEKLMEILPFEMEDIFLVESKELVMDLIPLEKKEKELYALVFAIEKSKLESYLKALGKEVGVMRLIAPFYDESLEDVIDEKSFNSFKLNFMPKEFLGMGKQLEKISLFKRSGFYICLLLLIVLAGELISFFGLKKKDEKLRSELLSSAMFLSQGQKIERDPAVYIRSKLMDLKTSYRSLNGIEILDIMKIFSESMPKGMKVKEISGESSRILLKGESKDSNLIEQFRANIKKLVKDARTTETKNLPDGSVSFVLEVDIDER